MSYYNTYEKNIPIYIIALILCLASTSCKRRPLTTADYMVILNIEIEKEIVNYEVEKDPSLMRCIFYDSESFLLSGFGGKGR